MSVGADIGLPCPSSTGCGYRCPASRRCNRQRSPHSSAISRSIKCHCTCKSSSTQRKHGAAKTNRRNGHVVTVGAESAGCGSGGQYAGNKIALRLTDCRKRQDANRNEQKFSQLTSFAMILTAYVPSPWNVLLCAPFRLRRQISRVTVCRGCAGKHATFYKLRNS